MLYKKENLVIFLLVVIGLLLYVAVYIKLRLLMKQLPQI